MSMRDAAAGAARGTSRSGNGVARASGASSQTQQQQQQQQSALRRQGLPQTAPTAATISYAAPGAGARSSSGPSAGAGAAPASSSAAAAGGDPEGGRSILICMLRLDLRIHDNALFHYAHRTAPPPRTHDELVAELRSASISAQQASAQAQPAVSGHRPSARPQQGGSGYDDGAVSGDSNDSSDTNPLDDSSPSGSNASSGSDGGAHKQKSGAATASGTGSRKQAPSAAAAAATAAAVAAADEAYSRWADEQSLHSQAQYLLPLYVFDEREIELSGLPGYKRDGPEARTREYGFWKMSGFRARFTAESVYDLRTRLVDRGSNLLVRFGKPEKVISNLVRALQENGDTVEAVWMQKEITHAEVQVENYIRTALDKQGVPLRFVHGKTLIHPVDLPFEVRDTPDVFTPFRKRVEALGPKMARPTLDAPARFKPFPPDLPETEDYRLDVTYEVDVDGLQSKTTSSATTTASSAASGATGSSGNTVTGGSIGSPPAKDGDISFYDILRYLLLPLNDSNLSPTLEGPSILQKRHPASALPLRGGESSALERLEWYFIRGKSADSSRWDRNDPPPVARYKQTRNNLVGHAYSTKMSPFLAYGSVSPRQIWEALDYHEQKFGEDQNTYWVRFELLWRDYFFFVAEKFGDLLFQLGGFELVTDPAQAEKKLQPGWWRGWDPQRDGPEHDVTRLLDGRTGIPFLDANVIELRESGFMSNRGRQNIASFLTKDLGCDWRIGAEFFQSHLIDYDPTSNYGNWQYVSGVGNDPRASRQFNTIKQAKDYDSYGEYVKTWIPSLRNMHPDYVHTPWLLDPEERRRYGLKTTEMDVTPVAYPARPMVEIESWKKHYERKEGVGSKMRGNPQEKVKDGRIRKTKSSHHSHHHSHRGEERERHSQRNPGGGSRGFIDTSLIGSRNYAQGQLAYPLPPGLSHDGNSGYNSQSDRESSDASANPTALAAESSYDTRTRPGGALSGRAGGAGVGGFIGGVLGALGGSTSSGASGGGATGGMATAGRSSPFGSNGTSVAGGSGGSTTSAVRPARGFASSMPPGQFAGPGAGAAAGSGGLGAIGSGSGIGRTSSPGAGSGAGFAPGAGWGQPGQLPVGSAALASGSTVSPAGSSLRSASAGPPGALSLQQQQQQQQQQQGAAPGAGAGASKADSEQSWRKAPGS